MWRKSGTKLQGRYPATPSGGFMLGLDEFVYLAKSNLNLTIWLVQMHSKLASLVRNNIWTCQIVKFALDFAKNTNPSRPSINPPVGVAGSVLIYIKVFQIGQKRLNEIKTNDVKKREKLKRFENRLKIWYKSSSPYDIFKGNDTSSIISISN